jgi:hypothetical protein
VPAPFDARPPAVAGHAVPDSGTAKPDAAPAPAPQEADVLADLPPAAPPAAPKFLDRVGGWVTTLAGSRTFQVLFPVLMLALTGSATYGAVRYRRRKRRLRQGQGSTTAADTATWLPGSSGSMPPERP